MASQTVLDVFPNAKIVMTHRDPVSTIPSYCSMEASLYKMTTDKLSHQEIGAFWIDKLKAWLDNFMQVRADAASNRFIDVNYKNLIDNPTHEGARVLEAANIPMSDHIQNGMEEWIEANRREHRASHKYCLEDFGLRAEDIRSKYHDYISKYV